MLKRIETWFTRLQLRDTERHLATIKRQLDRGCHRRPQHLVACETACHERRRRLQDKLQRLTT